MSKFADFLQEHKIDPRRLQAVSKRAERLRPEDRTLKAARAKSKSDESENKAVIAKPRSGRSVTDRLLSAATKGGKVSGPSKHRILRAVNQILEQRKQAPAELKSLF